MDLKGPDASSFGPASSRVRFWELDITQTEDIIKVVEEVVLDEGNRLAARRRYKLCRRWDSSEGRLDALSITPPLLTGHCLLYRL